MRGFVFTILSMVMVLSMLFILQISADTPYMDAITSQSAADALSYTFEDICDSFSKMMNVSVDVSYTGIVFSGQLPLPTSDMYGGADLTTRLNGFEQFIREYYLPVNYQLAFVSSEGNNITLSQSDNSFYVDPLDVWLQFSPNGREEIYAYTRRANISQISCINLNISLKNATLLLNDTGWLKLSSCTPQTTYCVNASVFVLDNSSTWAATNERIDLEKLSKIRASCGSACFVEMVLGSANTMETTQILKVSTHYPTINYQIGFCLNTTNDFRVVSRNKMRITDVRHNISRTDFLFLEGS